MRIKFSQKHTIKVDCIKRGRCSGKVFQSVCQNSLSSSDSRKFLKSVKWRSSFLCWKMILFFFSVGTLCIPNTSSLFICCTHVPHPHRHRFLWRCVPAAWELQRLHPQPGRQVHLKRQRVHYPGDHREGPAFHHPLCDQHAAHRLQGPRDHLRYRLTDRLEHPDPRPTHRPQEGCGTVQHKGCEGNKGWSTLNIWCLQ